MSMCVIFGVKDSPLQDVGYVKVRLLELTAGNFLKKAVFLDVAPCRYCVNRRFGGTYRLHLEGRKKTRIRERGPRHLLTLVPRSRILFFLLLP
jgi:hypothetical protein